MAATEKQYCLTLNLKNDQELIRQYEEYHRPGNVWPAVIDNILASGITSMQIYRSGELLIMVMTTTESFSFADKMLLDSQNPKVTEWEHLMERFQRLPDPVAASPKWQPIRNVFDLQQHRPPHK